MNTCDQVRPLLFDYQAGALEPAERDAVAAHLRQCATCPDLLARYKQERQVLAADFARQPRSDLAERVLGTARRRRRERLSLVAASVLVGLLAAWGAVDYLHHGGTPDLQAAPFFQEHLLLARIPQFRNAEQSPFLVQTSLASAQVDDREDVPVGSIPDSPELLPSSVKAPSYLPHGYILMGGRASPDGRLAHLVYTDGLHLLSLFEGYIPGARTQPVNKEIGGDLGTYHLMAWKGQTRDFLLLGEQGGQALSEIASRLEPVQGSS